MQLLPRGASAAKPAPAAGLADELLRAARLKGPQSDAPALAAAVALLGRVEPGVVARLRHLLPSLPAATQLALRPTLDAADGIGRREVRADSSVLGAGYSRDIDDGAG